MTRRPVKHTKRKTRPVRAVAGRVKSFTRRFHKQISAGSELLTVLSYVAALVTLVTLMVLIGFDHSDADSATIRIVIRGCQSVFAITILYNLILNFKATRRRATVLQWIADIALLLTVLPCLYPHPVHPWIVWLERLLYSNYFLYSVLTVFSVLELSAAITRFFGKRLNPSLLLGISFLAFTIIGSFVLMMPRCTNDGISYIDSLFVSGSAVCITGLTPVDVASTFTPLGNLVLVVLFEVGGLGILTFTCFFALFFSGNQSIYNQLLVRDIVYSKSMKSLVPTLLYILGFTVAIEAVGAVMLYVTTPDSLGMDVETKLAFSIFHSVSAFCNAGFSNIADGMANPALMAGNQSFYVALSALILAGGIGFPVLVNTKDAVIQWIRRLHAALTRRRPSIRRIHLFDLNTKLVVVTSLTLLFISSVVFFIAESSNTMEGMPVGKRIVQSVFNSLTPRSAGFVSLNPSAFLNITWVFVLFQMWIGGASQSMAGGIKVNTLATILLNLRSILTGRPNVTAFNRSIAIPSVRRANAVVTLSVLVTLATLMLLLVFDPGLSLKDVTFEAVSAVFTVGSSMGITPELTVASKITLIVAMFVGRVGLVSLLSGMFASRNRVNVTLPADNVIIN